MKLAIILVVVFVNLFDFFLKFLNYKNRNAKIPQSVQDVYDAETYKKRNAYAMEKLKHSTITGLVSLLVTLLYLIFDFHSLLTDFISQSTSSIYLQSYFMLGTLFAISIVLSIPFDLYDTFKIEAKYGFNKTSAKTFVGDTIKQILVGIVLYGGLLSLFLLLYTWLNEYVFYVFFFVLLVVSLVSALFYRQLAKLFNKFTPLEEGELKQKISAYAEKVGFSIKKIFVMDASKRSTKANAYFSGFGKSKSILLCDTLLEKFTSDEIVGILAHEVGHAKHKHVFISFLINLLTIALMLGVAYFVVANAAVSMAFGFADANVAFGLYILMIVFSALMLIINIPKNALSRKFEFQADKYACETANSEYLISALKKLAGVNYVNLVPHPFVVKMTYSHPPIADRVQQMNKY